MLPENQLQEGSISPESRITADQDQVSSMRNRLLGYLQSTKLEPMEEDLMAELTVPLTPPR